MLLLALIFNMNAIKVITNISNNSVYYIFYAVFILIGLLRIAISQEREINVDCYLLVALGVFLVYALASIIIKSNEYGIGMFAKFLSGLAVAYISSYLSREEKIRSFKMTADISFFYALYLLIRYDFVYRSFVRTRVYNYLMITLPLGIGLSLTLVFLLINARTMKERIFYLVSSIVQFMALLRFPARANTIFPFLIIVGYYAIKNRRSFKKLLLTVLISSVMLYGVYKIILSNGNNLLSTRIVRLLTNTGSEPRVILYRFYIDYLVNKANYIFGEGFAQSANILKNGFFAERYPHNLFLELICENGLFGFALIGVSLVRIIYCELKLKNSFDAGAKEEIAYFVILNIGLLFFLMTYAKSYSIYNGYQLFIFISMIVHENFLRKQEGQ